jgi:Xaa-Pro aminopeptidase
MEQKAREIRAEDINPRFNWSRALPALGIMGVDFEERVDYRRLHRYRLSRVKQALENSDLGALLVFDVNNIRYVTSTKIGEWERDKLSRHCSPVPASRSCGTSVRQLYTTSFTRHG